jgi:uncharacterized YccA/Bax inhibitor family protein
MAAASSNPAFSKSPAFSLNGATAAQLPRTGAGRDISPSQLDELYGRPSANSADTDRMTYENTIGKIIISFALLMLTAVVGWMMPIVAIPAAIVGFVLALVNIFKKKPSRGLVLAYAAVEGLFVGGISNIFEAQYGGIVGQAVLGTFVVVGVTLALFASGKIRASKRATQIFLVAMVGYLAFSLINFVLTLTGVTQNLRSAESFIPGVPWGAIIGVFVIILAAYSLVLDFTSIKTGVERGAPAIFGWQAAFGVMVTVVWLYVEILRLLSIFRD